MDDPSTHLAEAIGARIRAERTARSWTLDTLAETAGLSRRILVTVEQGHTNPSLSTLLRLSTALGIGLPALVAPPATETTSITRHGTGPQLWTGPLGGTGVLLAGTEQPNVVELWEWILQPAETHASDAHAHGTRELLQVQEGELTLTLGGTEILLLPGDALRFSGDAPHVYANPGDHRTRFTMTFYEPGVGAPRERAVAP